MTVFAATEVTEVYINSIDRPEVGECPSTDNLALGPSTAKAVKIESAAWYSAGGGYSTYLLSEYHQFVAGENYYLHIVLDFRDYYENNIRYHYVPGNDVDVNVPSAWGATVINKKIYNTNHGWYMSFDLKVMPKLTVNCLEMVGLDNLYVGEKPDLTFTTNEPKLFEVVDNMKWYPTASPSSVMKYTDTFLSGVKYTLEFQVEGAEYQGYFDQDVEIYDVGAETESIEVIRSYNHFITVKVHYLPFLTKVASASISGIKTPVAGEAPQKTGITTTTKYLKLSTPTWEGNFKDGKFRPGETYTLKIPFEVTSGGVDYITTDKVTLNVSAPKYVHRYEIGMPTIDVTFTVAGKKEVEDLGPLVIDLTENDSFNYFYNSASEKEKIAFNATFMSFYDNNVIKVVGSSTTDFDINNDGKADFKLIASAGIYSFSLTEQSCISGKKELKITSSMYSEMQDKNTKAYYSSYLFLTKPAAVTGLKAASAGKKKVTLTWNAVPGAEGYLVYGQKNKKYAYVGMTTQGTAFTDSKALDTDYNYYWVFAYIKDTSGKMIVSPAPAKYVYAKGVTKAVTNLKANGTTGKVTLTWTASEGADGYLIYGIRPGGSYGYIGMTSGTSFADTKASKTDWTFYWVYPYHKNGSTMVVGGTAKYVYSKAK